MTSKEEQILKAYLVHYQIISDESGFDEWYQLRQEDPEGEAEYKQTLDLAKTWSDGYREGWTACQRKIVGEAPEKRSGRRMMQPVVLESPTDLT